MQCVNCYIGARSKIDRGTKAPNTDRQRHHNIGIIEKDTKKDSWGRQRPKTNWDGGQDTQKTIKILVCSTKTPYTEMSRKVLNYWYNQ